MLIHWCKEAIDETMQFVLTQLTSNLGQHVNVIMKVILLGEWHAPSANTIVRNLQKRNA